MAFFDRHQTGRMAVARGARHRRASAGIVLAVLVGIESTTACVPGHKSTGTRDTAGSRDRLDYDAHDKQVQAGGFVQLQPETGEALLTITVRNTVARPPFTARYSSY